MQPHESPISNKWLLTLAGVTWVLGLLLAGSENPYMPWANIFGLLLFWVAGIIMAKQVVPSLNQKSAPVKPSPITPRSVRCNRLNRPESDPARSGSGCEPLRLGVVVGIVHQEGFRL